MDVQIRILFIVFLLVVNGMFSGAEIALLSLREGQLNQLERRSRTGRLTARLARDTSRFLTTVQIGITLAGFLASALAAVSLAEPLVPHLTPLLGDAAGAVAIIGVTAVLTFVTLVVGELAPKRVALQRAERWALVTAWPLASVEAVTRPAVWLLGRSADLVVRILGGDPARGREQVTEEEVQELVQTHRLFTDKQREIISGAIEVAARSLADIVVPRVRVFAVDVSTPAPDALRALAEAGHSRAPVVQDDLDHVIGVLHLRDLVDAEGPTRDHANDCLLLPETLGVLDALRRMQAERQHLAIVVNEYGGTEGIVTVEDLVEELVGEIHDEVDPDLLAVEYEADGTALVPGSFPVHDLVDLGVAAPRGRYATVAGLLLDRLGHLPAPGETVDVGDHTMTVVAVEERAISRVRIATRHARSR